MMAGTPGVALPSSRLAVVDATQVGEARRLAAAECRVAGLDETHAGRVALVVTEAATNIVRHGSGGEILLRVLHADGARGIEVLAVDTGRGIEDVGRALRDGHSTAGTPGTGLGAIRRLSTVFDIYTSQGGTALLSQVWTGTPALPVHGAVCVAKPGETESGDVWALQVRPGGWRLIVADGLGHGLHAREAAVCVANAMLGARDGLAGALNTAHLAARPTRGAAAAAAEVMPRSREVTYAGIGNVSGMLLSSGGSRSMVSVNGTLGQGILRPREFSYPLPADSLVVLFSDGLVSHWSLDTYPGLSGRHPALVTGVLYRDHSRRRDDVTVVAVRVPALQ
jgi:anti-sigma regulatory factor (Ser/Thr protein kinase)